MRAPLSDDELYARLKAVGFERDESMLGPPPSKNRTVVCRAGKKRVLVKIADGPGNVGVLREGSVLERVQPLAAERDSPLLLPTIHLFDPVRGFLALDWLPQSETLHHFHRRTREYPESVGTQIGLGLGYLHHKSRASPSRYALAEAFREETDLIECFLRLRPDFFVRLSGVGIDLCVALQANKNALRGLDVLMQWQTRDGETCLLHGDMRQANLVRVGRSKNVPLVFLDWELSLWGDPARDLGSLLSDYVLGWLFPEHPSEVMSTETLQKFCASFTQAYQVAREPLFRFDSAFKERVVRWVGAALLIYVYGISHYEQKFDERAHGIQRQCLDMLATPERWVQMLWRPS